MQSPACRWSWGGRQQSPEGPLRARLLDGGTRVPDGAQAEGSGGRAARLLGGGGRAATSWTRAYSPRTRGGGCHSSNFLARPWEDSPSPSKSHCEKAKSNTFFFPPPRLRTGGRSLSPAGPGAGGRGGQGRTRWVCLPWTAAERRKEVRTKVQVTGSPAGCGVQKRRVKLSRKST